MPSGSGRRVGGYDHGVATIGFLGKRPFYKDFVWDEDGDAVRQGDGFTYLRSCKNVSPRGLHGYKCSRVSGPDYRVCAEFARQRLVVGGARAFLLRSGGHGTKGGLAVITWNAAQSVCV